MITQTQDIYWRNLPKDTPLVMKGQAYVTPEGAVVYWMGHEAREAQRALNKRVEHHVPGCDADLCTTDSGELRVLPTGGEGNAILCRACFNYEMRFRRDFNKHNEASLPLVSWPSLKVYES